MAKTYRIDLSTRRAKLKARNEPYWQRVPSHKGLSVGYRKSTSGAESWHCRDLTGKPRFKSLGPIANLSFEDATRQALEWVQGPRLSAETPSTVWEAAERYLEHIKGHKKGEQGERAHKEAKQRLTRLVKNDPIATVRLEKFTPDTMADWQSRHAAGRSQNTANRDFRTLRSVLNLALKREWILKAPWKQVSLLPGEEPEEVERAAVINPEQIQALIEACDDDLAPLVKTMFWLGCRPIEIRQVTRGDLRNGGLRLWSHKGPKARKQVRWFPLTKTQESFLKKVSAESALRAGKHPHTPLFLRSTGDAWPKEWFNKKFAEARNRAGLPENVLPYSARRSEITRLFKDGMDTATISKLMGTGIKQLQDDYFELQEERTRKELERLAIDL